MEPAHLRYKPKIFVGSSHRWTIDQFTRFPKTAEILDVGAGSGFAARNLRPLGFEHFQAVEIDPEAIRELSSLYSRIEPTPEGFEKSQFDIALCLDILEHTASPEKFLKAIVDVLKPGGYVLISVPNITHWSIRLKLLTGQFEYQDRGILDRTHLQFITRNRLRIMCESLGMKTLSEDSTIEPVELLLPDWSYQNIGFRFLSRIRLALARTWPSLMAFQHLAVVQKNELNAQLSPTKS